MRGLRFRVWGLGFKVERRARRKLVMCPICPFMHSVGVGVNTTKL